MIFGKWTRLRHVQDQIRAEKGLANDEMCTTQISPILKSCWGNLDVKTIMLHHVNPIVERRL